MYSYYGTMSEAHEYFANRLHEEAWSMSTLEDRRRALIRSTQIIDALNFKGEKSAVHTIRQGRRPSAAELREADLSQELEFPRGTDVDIPTAIKVACWEVAHALLDGVDPDLELENLGVVSQGIVSVRTTYNRDHSQIQHLIHGVPSAAAWRYLRPFLRDDDTFKLSRVD